MVSDIQSVTFRESEKDLESFEETYAHDCRMRHFGVASLLRRMVVTFGSS